MAAFISFHAWHSVPGRQFAPSWTVCTNPPFSPTAAPVPVTIDLSPTRKDTTKRHWQQPLVSGLRSGEACTSIHRVLEVLTWLRLHWKDRFGHCAPFKPVTTVQKLAGFLNLRKTTLPGGFFVSEMEDTPFKAPSSRNAVARKNRPLTQNQALRLFYNQVKWLFYISWTPAFSCKRNHPNAHQTNNQHRYSYYYS